MSDKAHREWQYFLSAVMFYTRIPVSSKAEHSQEILNRSRKYFSAIGILIGSIAAVTFMLANLFLASDVSVALSMLATILATGAFHEDGFADSCDGLGGGWSKEQVLTIMKDSRVGTYATVGLIAILGLKFLILSNIANALSPTIFALIYICGHTLSRQLSSSMIERFNYVQDIDLSKVKPITDRHLSPQDVRLSYLITLSPLLILASQGFVSLLLAVFFAWFAVTLFMRYCDKRIGGYTGDCLGAVQQISEVFFYLILLCAW